MNSDLFGTHITSADSDNEDGNDEFTRQKFDEMKRMQSQSFRSVPKLTSSKRISKVSKKLNMKKMTSDTIGSKETVLHGDLENVRFLF